MREAFIFGRKSGCARVFFRESIFSRRRTFRDSDRNQNRRTVRRFLSALLVVPGCLRSVRLRFREKPVLSLLRILPMRTAAVSAEGRRKKNEEGAVERLGSLKGPEDLVLWKSDFSRIRTWGKVSRANRNPTLGAPDISSVGLRQYFPEQTRFRQASAKSEDSTSRTSNLWTRPERDTMSDGLPCCSD